MSESLRHVNKGFYLPAVASASSAEARQGALSLQRLPTIPPLIRCPSELQGTFGVITPALSLLQPWAYVLMMLLDWRSELQL